MKILLVSAAAVGILMAGTLAQTSNKNPQKTEEKAEKEKPASDTTKGKEESTYVSPDKGIGPIKEIKLGPIDSTMAARGEELFAQKCVTCHQLDKKKLGPPLRGVTKQRPPEFIMNMMLNTDEMENKDDEVKKLIDEYQVYMTVQDINKKQARDLLEYLRLEGEKEPEK